MGASGHAGFIQALLTQGSGMFEAATALLGPRQAAEETSRQRLGYAGLINAVSTLTPLSNAKHSR